MKVYVLYDNDSIEGGFVSEEEANAEALINNRVGGKTEEKGHYWHVHEIEVKP